MGGGWYLVSYCASRSLVLAAVCDRYITLAFLLLSTTAAQKGTPFWAHGIVWCGHSHPTQVFRSATSIPTSSSKSLSLPPVLPSLIISHRVVGYDSVMSNQPYNCYSDWIAVVVVVYLLLHTYGFWIVSTPGQTHTLTTYYTGSQQQAHYTKHDMIRTNRV